MTQEEKELLLSDLSARLPYEVKLGFYAEATKETYTCTLLGLEPENDKPVIAKTDRGSFYMLADHVKPYLFPMSSMTEEQRIELNSLLPIGVSLQINSNNFTFFEIDTDIVCCFHIEFWNKFFEWLLKNNFDFRGLIHKGLANDATGLNIY